MTNQENSPQNADNTYDQRTVRLDKLEALRHDGQDPFRANWEQTHTSTQARALYTDPRERKNGESHVVQVAGRIVAFRLMGKASFLKILDRNGQIQAYVSRDLIGEIPYTTFKKLDLGDIIGIQGTLFKTKTGEITVRAKAYQLLAKALRPLPEKWHGLTNSDHIYRQRYLDLIANTTSRSRFRQRSRIIQEIRRFLWQREFIEVETPILQNVAGGAAARPFTTHFNALGCDFYLRISLELHLKRLLVGGFDRVFELGRTFRNEGLSRRHNPEFTLLELYQCYSDYRGMMRLIYDLIQHLCYKALEGRTTLKRSDGQTIELGGQWREATYRDLIREGTGASDWFERSCEAKRAWCVEAGIQVNPEAQDFEITHNVFEKRVEPSLIQPTFVTHLPKELCPLAKTNLTDPTVLDVFELCINGQEIAPAYSEQNDPILQREMFENQIGEDRQNLDNDFLEALEYGMPPAGGIGIGIDRLCVLLTNADSIRDTLLFPAMRPV